MRPGIQLLFWAGFVLGVLVHGASPSTRAADRAADIAESPVTPSAATSTDQGFQEVEPDKLVWRILQSYDQLERELNPVRAVYHVDVLRTAEWFAVRQRTLSDADEPDAISASEHEDLHYSQRGELARKGRKLYGSLTGPQVATTGLVSPVDETDVIVYNGDYTVKFFNQKGQDGRPRYHVSGEPSAPTFEDPWEVTGRRYVESSLGNLDEISKDCRCQFLQERDEGKDGLLLWQVYCPESKYLTKIWLRANQSYVVHKLERYVNGRLTWVIDEVEYQSVDGVPFPKSCVKSTFSEETFPAGTLLQRIELAALSATTDPDEIPDSLFELEIPEGATVVDVDTGMKLRNPDLIQQQLAELAGEGRSRSWRFWAVVAFNLALITCFGIWRLCVARSKSTEKPGSEGTS